MDTYAALLSLSDLAKNRPSTKTVKPTKDVRPLTARVAERMWIDELVAAR